jgi:hypothetical protein
MRLTFAYTDAATSVCAFGALAGVQSGASRPIGGVTAREQFPLISCLLQEGRGGAGAGLHPG